MQINPNFLFPFHNRDTEDNRLVINCAFKHNYVINKLYFIPKQIRFFIKENERGIGKKRTSSKMKNIVKKIMIQAEKTAFICIDIFFKNCQFNNHADEK